MHQIAVKSHEPTFLAEVWWTLASPLSKQPAWASSVTVVYTLAQLHFKITLKLLLLHTGENKTKHPLALYSWATLMSSITLLIMTRAQCNRKKK